MIGRRQLERTSTQCGETERCLAAQEYDLQLIRCAVQLLSAPDVEVQRLVDLARQGRCLSILRAAALAATGHVTDIVGPWTASRAVPAFREPTIPAERFPHGSRFMIMAGRDRISWGAHDRRAGWGETRSNRRRQRSLSPARLKPSADPD